MTAFLNKPGDIVEVPCKGKGASSRSTCIFISMTFHIASSLPGLVPSARSFQVDPGGKSFNTAGVMSWFVGRLEDWKVLEVPLRGYPKDVRSKKGPLVGCFI